MRSFLDPEGRALDAIWRARYGQPLPIAGCAHLVRDMLAIEDAGAEAPRIASPPEEAAAPGI